MLGIVYSCNILNETGKRQTRHLVANFTEAKPFSFAILSCGRPIACNIFYLLDVPLVKLAYIMRN